MSTLRKFKHQISDPLVALNIRSAENLIVEPDASDILAMARRLTVELAHFYESETGQKLRIDVGSPASILHDMIVDAADTIKHGNLRKKERQTAFQTALEFDVRDKEYRFFRTAIWARSERFGEYDLIETLGEYAISLAIIMNIEWSLTFDVTEQPFYRCAVIVVGDRNPDPSKILTCFYDYDEIAKERRQLDKPPIGFRLRIENRSGQTWDLPSNAPFDQER